jgi:transcription elongation factor GreA-like protein
MYEVSNWLSIFQKTAITSKGYKYDCQPKVLTNKKNWTGWNLLQKQGLKHSSKIIALVKNIGAVTTMSAGLSIKDTYSIQ